MTQHLSRRQLLTLGLRTGLGLGAGALLAACQPKAEPTPVPEPAKPAPAATAPVKAPEAKIQIRVQCTAGPRWVNTVKWPADEFAKAFPNVEVVIEETIYDEIPTKTETGFVAGTLQDICTGHNRWYFYGCYKGIYRSLQDYIDSNPPEEFEDFFAAGMEAQKFDGKQYCLPGMLRPGPLTTVAYNKTILDEMGVPEPKEPWNINQLAEMAIKATNKDKGYFGVYWPTPDIHRFENYTRYFGKPSLDDQSSWTVVEDGKKFRLDTPTIEEAARLRYELIHTHHAFPLESEQVQGGLFAAGKLAFELSGTVAFHTTKKTIGDKFQIGAGLGFTGPEGRKGTAQVCNQWIMNSKCAHPDETWEFMKILTGKENAWRQALETVEPGRRSGWVHPKVLEAVPIYAEGVKLMDEYLEPFPMCWNLRYVEANSIFKNETDLIWLGEKTWEEHAPVVQKKVQAIFDLERPSKS